MSKEGSVAPKERINIKYIPATGMHRLRLSYRSKPWLLVISKGMRSKPHWKSVQQSR